MSQSLPEPESGPTCWECGATNDPDASECWLCGRRDWHAPHRLPMPMKAEPPPTSGDGSAPVLLVLGLVALGGLAIAPGLAIGLAIFALPAWGVAEFIARRRRNRGLPTSTATKFVWIAMLTVAIPILLGLALFITIWLICLVEGPPKF